MLCAIHSTDPLLNMCVCVCVCVYVCSVLSDSVTAWTSVAHLASLSMGFLGQEYWSGLPFPTPGDLLDPGIEPKGFASPALSAGFFTTAMPGKAPLLNRYIYLLLYEQNTH